MENVLAAVREFLSTFSLRRATLELKPISNFGLISIHALLAESDCAAAPCPHGRCYFYPRSPCGERRAYSLPSSTISTISIHALLAESDSGRGKDAARYPHFYPRSPCGERPQISARALRSWAYFYPRSPCGERPLLRAHRPPRRHFYPRSPCGERPAQAGGWGRSAPISIHALLAESDRFQAAGIREYHRFLSTLSLRRATKPGFTPTTLRQNFYPRSPCGERPVRWHNLFRFLPFLSTLSLRRATVSRPARQCFPPFLSTLSLRRATFDGCSISATLVDFYPRSPCGERPA